jgi:hypothetical protein
MNNKKDTKIIKDVKNNEDQDSILNYKPTDFKETELQTYTLKINSKDRNYIREPNPFKFEISFNDFQEKVSLKAIISSKFENIKRICLSLMIIPRYIPRDYIGEPVTGITPIYNSPTSVSLSYYPGININNTVISVLNLEGDEIKIEVIELVDLFNKKLYLVALQYNNPYYLTKYINMKADLFSYVNINNIIYPVSNIIGNILTLENTDYFPLPMNTNNRLIIADFYKNTIMIDTDGTKIGFNEQTIQIYEANILNFQYLFENQYIEYIVDNSVTNNILQRYLFKISSIVPQLIDPSESSSIENTVVIINGLWIGKTPSFSGVALYFDKNNLIRLNQFNFGVRDLFEERMFFLNLNPFVPAKNVSTDPSINNTFGILYPSTPNSTKDYLYLRGDAIETYTNVNLQNTNNKIQFSLMDSNNVQIGLIYNKYLNLYQPNDGVLLTSYLAFLPDINIILKIEEVDKKFINLG